MSGLDRFVEAQAKVYPEALAELRAGVKRSHWMWFVFPQIEGLGRSPTARFYAIRGRDEALAYLMHDTLGPRLLECMEAILSHAGKLAPQDILGPVDALKFRSSMTLFEEVADDPTPFAAALDQLCDGERDQATLDRL